MWKTIINLLFPVYCLGCNQPGQFICRNCFNQLPFNRKSPIKFYPTSALFGLIITSFYESPLVKQIIHKYKYDFIQDLAKPLGQLMAKRLSISSLINNNIVLIPVPLHKKRLRWRGFNQAELLAFEVGQQLKIQAANDILIRTKHTLPQVNIKSSKQRKENIKQSFSVNPDFKNNLKNKTIILIDDISTTGATLEECALTLSPLKPKQIWGLVMAHG